MRGKLFLWSLLSGLLLSVSWPPYGFAPILFVAFLPLLIVQHTVQTDNRLRAHHLFLYAYLTFLVWNALTTWWVWNASPVALLAFTANSLLMTLVFLVYHKVRLHLPQRYSAFTLPVIWITFEYLHLQWDLTWPWLTLGNAFSELGQLVQWYEYTGVFGGSFWVLLANVLIFELFVYRHTFLRPLKKKLAYWSALGVLLIVPAILSLIRYMSLREPGATTSIDVVVVQPNIDPYGEKFDKNDRFAYRKQLYKMLKLAAQKTDTAVDYLVLPETALVEDLWENYIGNTWSIVRLDSFRRAFPKLKIVTGASTYYKYESWETPPHTARKFADAGEYYDSYNTALQIDADSSRIQLYHKSKLVPGVENMPFAWLSSLSIDLGGTTGILGTQEERTALASPDGKIKVAPVICYESIFGEYVGGYLENGAEYIFIITNDGWWGNTPGYKQHLHYGRLRAIETRKGIARAANTGISCFIDVRGDIHQATDWWKPDVIRARVESVPGRTFYSRHGDYVARISMGLSFLAIGLALVRHLRTRFKKS